MGHCDHFVQISGVLSCLLVGGIINGGGVKIGRKSRNLAKNCMKLKEIGLILESLQKIYRRGGYDQRKDFVYTLIIFWKTFVGKKEGQFLESHKKKQLEVARI